MISYKKLWIKLVEFNMKKIDLKNATDIGSTTLFKLTHDQPVSMEVLVKICTVLKCNIGDIVDIIVEE